MDFLPALMLLAIIGIFGLEQAVKGSLARGIVRGTWCLLLVYSVLFNALAGIKAHAMENWFDGNVYFGEGQMDKAIKCFKTATTQGPQSASFHVAPRKCSFPFRAG